MTTEKLFHSKWCFFQNNRPGPWLVLFLSLGKICIDWIRMSKIKHHSEFRLCWIFHYKISRRQIFLEFFETLHEWKPYQWILQEPRKKCRYFLRNATILMRVESCDLSHNSRIYSTCWPPNSAEKWKVFT